MVAGDMSRRSLVEELVFALLQCACRDVRIKSPPFRPPSSLNITELNSNNLQGTCANVIELANNHEQLEYGWSRISR